MKIITALFLTLAASSVFAAEQAHTGVPLDVAKTISITDTSKACGIVPVELVYEDSRGVQHTVSYSVLGNGCAGS
ncbi:DUF2790 domain-containing protein [Pseudomonas sp. SZMC_28357]|uniref:DUF2790 domain-containing protein n=1 Tax=Pseudomonas sp. SZMC_28357 TaxID=3074380 RepID=UPI0028714F8E|nr:DUF2790 domain-containing protein [Pseudomonas sp. SZMC_28357]MDR9750878.1 DUF2790 domain-containing protein [Pseudomonas sp. SZMC_28357]